MIIKIILEEDDEVYARLIPLPGMVYSCLQCGDEIEHGYLVAPHSMPVCQKCGDIHMEAQTESRQFLESITSDEEQEG